MTKSLVPLDLPEVLQAMSGSPVAAYLLGLSSARSRKTLARAQCEAASLLLGKKVNWLGATNVFWLLDRHELLAVRAKLADRVGSGEISASWANLVLAALRGTCNEARKTAHREGLPRGILPDFPRPDPARKPHLSLTGYRKLMDTCRRDMESDRSPEHRAAGSRDAAILAVARTAIPRVSELSRLKVSDFEDGAIFFRTKGNGAKVIDLPRDARRAVEDWLAVRGSDEGALFSHINKAGAIKHKVHLGPRGIQAMVARRCERAKVEPFGFHEFRRFLITRLLDEGKLAEAKYLAGHRKETTTLAYDLRARERAAEALRKERVHYKRAR